MIRWRVNLPKAAKAGLREESLKYERKEKGLGKRFLNEVTEIRKRLVTMPERFQAWPDDARYRRVMLTSFPFAVFYLLDEPSHTVLIAAVVDLRREPGYWQTGDEP